MKILQRPYHHLILSTIIIFPILFLLSCSKGIKPGLGPDFVGNGVVHGKVYLKDMSDSSDITITLTNTPLKGTTAADGSYKVEGLAVGTYILTASKEHFGAASAENIIVSGAGVSYHVPDLSISLNDAVVNGKVVDSSGQPIANVNVNLDANTPKPTDSNGNFSFTGLTNLSYRVVVGSSNTNGYANEVANVNVNTPGVFSTGTITLYKIDQGIPTPSGYYTPMAGTMLAESFIPTKSSIKKVRLYVQDQLIAFTVEIRSDNNGKPSGTVLAHSIQTVNRLSYTLDAFTPGALYAGEDFYISPVSLSPGTKYWIVVYRVDGQDISCVVYGDSHNSYADGEPMYSCDNGSSWNPFGGSDLLFYTMY